MSLYAHLTSLSVIGQVDKTLISGMLRISYILVKILKQKHLKNVGPIRHCEPPHAHSPDVASGTVARRLRIDVHDYDDNDNDRGDRYGPMEWAQLVSDEQRCKTALCHASKCSRGWMKFSRDIRDR